MALVILGVGYINRFLFNIVKRWDSRFVAVVLMAAVAMSFLPMPVIGKLIVVDLFVSGGLIGFAVARGPKRPISIVVMILTLACNAYWITALQDAGFDTTVPVTEEYWNQEPPPVHVDDPSCPGPYRVRGLTYGSGTDQRRPEYGSNVTLKTTSVDATPFFDQSTGFFNFVRKLYWGFNSKNYPLNARVWYPDAAGPFPLVLIVHGNHLMSHFSDAGYDYLGKLLASRGLILASVDENFLNLSWIQDYEQSEVFARGWLLLKHLEQWRKWNDSEGNPFSKKVDMNNIALIGHSRGGAAVAVAAAINRLKRFHGDGKQEFNFNFSIKGVVQIAPNDPYSPEKDVPIRLENTNYLILQGGYDQDMSWFLGNRVYNRVRFTDGKYHFKSALYIYRANHGQFNTSWGREDYPAPMSWLLDLKPIMRGDDQRKIAGLYISTFLESTLLDNRKYMPFLKDYRNAREYVPQEYYVNQFEDSSFRYAANYEEDYDITTASVKGGSIQGKNLKLWNENALSFRDEGGSSQHTLGVYLGWDRKDTLYKGRTAEYDILLGESAGKSLRLQEAKNFIFSVCNNRNDIDTLDFSIELISKKDSATLSLRHNCILPPPLKTSLTKWPFIYALAKGKPVERVLQLVEIRLTDFVHENQRLRPGELTEIRFIFDRSDVGEIFVSRVGFD
jgi:dienelactone hydrolase